MPKILEELQLPSLTAVIKPKEGVSLFNSGGVIKLLHADGTEQTLMTSSADGTLDLSNYYTKTEIDELISGGVGGAGFNVEIVEELPDAGNNYTIYLLRDKESEKDIYTEYLYINDKWEILGTTEIDLSGYALKTDIPTNVSQLVNDAGYIIEHQDLSDLATDEDLQAVDLRVSGLQVNLSNNYYTKTEVDEKIITGGTGGSADLSNYYTKAEIDAMDLAGKVKFRDWTEEVV